jgi:hypothetical protein
MYCIRQNMRAQFELTSNLVFSAQAFARSSPWCARFSFSWRGRKRKDRGNGNELSDFQCLMIGASRDKSCQQQAVTKASTVTRVRMASPRKVPHLVGDHTTDHFQARYAISSVLLRKR